MNQRNQLSWLLKKATKKDQEKRKGNNSKLTLSIVCYLSGPFQELPEAQRVRNSKFNNPRWILVFLLRLPLPVAFVPCFRPHNQKVEQDQQSSALLGAILLLRPLPWHSALRTRMVISLLLARSFQRKTKNQERGKASVPHYFWISVTGIGSNMDSVFLIFFDRNTADSTTTWWDDRVLSKSLF
jgi:hypothetical protein